VATIDRTAQIGASFPEDYDLNMLLGELSGRGRERFQMNADRNLQPELGWVRMVFLAPSTDECLSEQLDAPGEEGLPDSDEVEGVASAEGYREFAQEAMSWAESSMAASFEVWPDE
jgi:hypothetical protein